MQETIFEKEVFEGFRLSPQQEYLWTLQQNGNAARYHAQCSILIEGQLVAEVLKTALQRVIGRHDILRTTFSQQPGVKVPLQVISERADASLRRINLAGLDAPEQKAKIAELYREDSRHPFNFKQAPLLRATLITLAEDKHTLQLSLPALCADSHTLKNLMREISLAYAARLSGDEVDEEVTQYVQFSEWQNDLLLDGEAEEGKEFWRKQNVAAVSRLSLSLENKTDAAPNFTPESLTLNVPSALYAKVQEAARRDDVSIELFLFACWQTLLWRLSEESGIVTGYVSQGRKYEELRAALGLFATWFPVSVQLNEDYSFGEVLKQVRRFMTEAEEWQEYFTFNDDGELSATRTVFPATIFEYEEECEPSVSAGLRFSLVDRHAAFAPFGLLLSCVHGRAGISLRFSFDSSIFSVDAIHLLALRFLTLLSSVIERRSVTLAELDLISADERSLLLSSFNDSRCSFPAPLLLHRLFEQQVELTPDALALVCEDRRLSYRELNGRANQLAHRLIACGVKTDDLVALLVDRSPEMVIAMLATLKAGGAYLPLDAHYPDERLCFMLADAGVEVVLTQPYLLERVPQTQAQVICLEHESADDESADNPRTEVLAQHLAYVIYTSGSTGKPKGVAIPHAAIANHMLWMQQRLPLRVTDAVLQKTPFSFDASVWEFFAPLLCGARLVIARPGGHSDAAYLIETIRTHEVTVLQVVPTLLHMLVEGDEFGRCVSLRRLFCGGEALGAELVERVRRALPATQVYNLYGPTEATIDASFWECATPAGEALRQVSIGTPVANTQFYVLDERQQLVPVGAAGELYIGGAGLARGYLGRADLTAERFVPHPFSDGGERLYRTGDLVRHHLNAEVEYLGRLDDQVKVRGFRIELGEVETAALSFAGVRAAVVIARAGAGGEQQLVCYVVGGGEEQSESGEFLGNLREHLRRQLPDYMLPASFVRMERLPLQPNGKVDRRALPAPEDGGKIARNHRYESPRTAVEELMSGIWSEVLDVEAVGVTDSFFDLGGHSLLATQLISRMRKAFGVEIGLGQLFQAPTIAELAPVVEAALRGGEGVKENAIEPVSRAQRLPLSFAQQRLWFLDQLEPGSPLYNVSVAVRLSGQLNREALQLTLDEIVRRHESLRTTFALNGGNQPVQVINAPRRLELLQYDLSGLAPEAGEAEAARLIAELAQRPYELSRGPLLRAQLLRLGEEEQILSVAMHHIVTDAWSMGVLVKEVATLYPAYVEGRPSPLPEPAIQYADFAHWQREWLQGAVLDEQLSYWREQLRGAPGLLELATDRERAAVQSFRGAAETFKLAEELKRGLKELSRSEGVTLFMTLLAAFKTLLHRYSGQVDIILGTDVANRNWAETEPLFGFFVNQLVLRTNLSGNPTFLELLGRVRKVTLGAYAHQDMPFDKLVETLRPDRAISHTPLFQAKLVLQNAPMPPLELPGLTLQPVDNGNASSTAKFDLMLTLIEMPDGMWGVMEYSTELFEVTTIMRMLRDFEALLGDIVARPETPINALQIVSETEKEQQELEKRKREQANLRKIRGSKPKAVNFSQKSLVHPSRLPSGKVPPLVLQPGVENVDLLGWAKANRESIEINLRQYGGILFRGFEIASQDKFEQFLQAISLRLMQYTEGATPRTQVGDRIYTSTEYPPDQTIALHNELTYVTTWPMKILFCCLQTAEKRGETPIADVRRVLQRINPQVKQRFIEKGWMLVRNFGAGLSLPWQTSFHTTEKAEVEAYCRRARIDWEWKGESNLRTRQTRSAVVQHPHTGEMVWFNHVAFWHVSSLELKVREAMRAMFKEDELPYNTYYGDGSPIEDSVVEEIREAYNEETIAFGWQRGDVLLLDNMLVAHGRNSYLGPRRILAAMGNAFDSTKAQETE
jgi:amino acid adenylation domain-containing protein